MKPYFSDSGITLYVGDCLDVLPTLPAESVDAIVTDPPYGLEFMGKQWDAPWKRGEGTGGHNAGFSPGAPAVAGVRGAIKALPSYTGSTNPTCRNCGGTRNGKNRKSRRVCSCDNPLFPNTTLPRMVAFQMWALEWAKEALRVAKPGAHLLAFGGTRTHHRLVCAIEDAGWEIRDTIMWVYGSGFPKSLDVSKAIDKEAGAERGIVGSKTVTRDFRDISGGRYGDKSVESETHTVKVTAPATEAAKQWDGWGTSLKPSFEPVCLARKPLIGTVAANVQRYGTGALNIDASRIGTDGGNRRDNLNTTEPRGAAMGAYSVPASQVNGLGRWPANLITDGSPEVVECFPETGESAGGSRGAGGQNGRYGPIGAQPEIGTLGFGDSGSAARFFYCAKASRADRYSEAGNDHPTVKPVALIQYLIRLITPPGGIVLDPFSGSGTTPKAARELGFKCIAIDLEERHQEIAKHRLNQGVLDFGAA